MAELSKNLALRTKAVVQAAEGNRGDGGKFDQPIAAPRRQPRFYKAKAAAISAPASATQPGSGDCVLMKFDGTDLVETQTTEKIYSRHAIAKDTIFEVHQIGGYPFAIKDVPAHVHFTAPDAGIPGGGSAECDVISYSDGRDVESGEKVTVENWTTEAVCETASHKGKAEQWGDAWHIYAEDRVCEEEEPA